jgi:predicted HicB family RNase H-like nuclease
MPNQWKTPARSVRVRDELWNAAKVAAEERGESISAVLVRALREYVQRAP